MCTGQSNGMCGLVENGTRHWVDRCHHKPEQYVGSFEWSGKFYDLYFLGDALGEVCIRYGHEPEEYIGTDLKALIELSYSGLKFYIRAMHELESNGTISWARKE